LLYSNIAAGAETGWDFSTRWFIGGMKLDNISTNNILPVDLNAILYQFEMNMASFYAILGNNVRQNFFINRANDRKQGMWKLLWSESEHSWFDLEIETRDRRKLYFPSNFFPLWTGAYDESNLTETSKNDIVRTIESNLIFKGGVVTSQTQSSQQWDFPNAWPPLQDIMIRGLLKLNTNYSNRLAYQICNNWITSNIIGLTNNQTMFEKYNALEPGQRGSGGEYNPQEGFGWTNGVFLSLLNDFGHQIDEIFEEEKINY